MWAYDCGVDPVDRGQDRSIERGTGVRQMGADYWKRNRILEVVPDYCKRNRTVAAAVGE